MRSKIVAGNWKSNGKLAVNQELITKLKAAVKQGKATVLVCPSFVHLQQVTDLCKGSSIQVGAQNLSLTGEGAFTGEITGGMLKDMNLQFVLVGHSERRSLFGETNEVVANKVKIAINAGLMPVLCVGETLEEREANQIESVISAQLDAVIKCVGIAAFEKIIIAYEPVWAIGTGKTASPEQAQEVHKFIRCFLAKSDDRIASLQSILYGGSVKASSAQALFTMPDIDGGLVGGASLDANEFAAIIAAAG